MVAPRARETARGDRIRLTRRPALLGFLPNDQASVPALAGLRIRRPDHVDRFTPENVGGGLVPARLCPREQANCCESGDPITSIGSLPKYVGAGLVPARLCATRASELLRIRRGGPPCRPGAPPPGPLWGLRAPRPPGRGRYRARVAQTAGAPRPRARDFLGCTLRREGAMERHGSDARVVMTYQDYLELPDDGKRHEILD